MSVCPWCKASVPSSSGPCPACGNDPANHPSIASSGFGVADPFDDLDADPGDLGLGTPQFGAVSHGSSSSFGSDSFDDDEGDPNLRLELGDAPVRAAKIEPPSSHAQPPAAASPHPAGAGQEPHPPSSVRARIVPQSPALDPYEIAVLAEFGRPPAQIWNCPAYAVRVFLRTRDLRRMLAAAQRRAGEAERLRDDSLATIAEKVRPSIAEDRELAGYLAPLARIEETAREREHALSARSAEYSAKVAVVDQQLADEENRASEISRRRDLAASEHDARAQVLSRAQAQLKRAEIELRNAQQVARAAACQPGSQASPEQTAALATAQKAVEQRRLELQTPTAAAAESADALRGVEAELAEAERRIAALRTERRTCEATFAREAGLRSEGVEQALTEKRAALIALGARLFDTNSSAILPEDAAAFGRLRTEVSQLHLEVERCLRAIDSADKTAVKKGWAIIAAAAVLLITLVVLTFGPTG